MSLVFQRALLYEEVWSTPITTLAKMYGLSDNGLRKICVALNVPLPEAGHWMKVEAGKMISRTELPAECDQTSFVSTQARNPEEPSFESQEDAIWLESQLNLERQPERSIVVVQKPKIWHPAVAPLHDWLKECARDYNIALKKKLQHEKKVKSRGVDFWDTNFQPWDFNRHHPVLGSSHKAMAMRVSIDSYERALAIFNAIAVDSEKRGFSVNLGEKRERLYLHLESSRIGISIVEQSSKDTDADSTPTEPEAIPRKSGPLRLNIGRYVGDAYPIEETNASPLEYKLNVVFEKSYRLVVRDRVQKRKWDFAQQRAEEARRVKEDLEKERLDNARSLAQQKAVRDELLEQSNDLIQAGRIRSLIAHLDKMRGEGAPSKAFLEWTNWANQIADDIDPTAKLLTGLGELGDA